MKLNRRQFLKATAAFFAGNLIGVDKLLRASAGMSRKPEAGVMPVRKLGRTGYDVSLFSLGGQATVEMRDRPAEAAAIINRALDLGVNYIDTASNYGVGGSETNIGLVMKERRDEVFLASKTNDRSYSGTMRLFEQSLSRLNTGYLDLYQLHSVRTEDDLAAAFSSDGAVRAMEELKRAGAVRHLGITGHHNPDILIKGINEYDFDCLLMTLNAGDIHFRPFQKDLLEKAVEKDMGIIAMKVAAKGKIFRSGGITSMRQALGYVLNFPVSTAVVGISNIRQVEENALIAREFEPFSDEEISEIQELTRGYEHDANFFKYLW